MRKLLAFLAFLALALPANAEGIPSLSGYSAPRPITCHLQLHGQGSFVFHEANMGPVTIDSLGDVGTGAGLGTGCALITGNLLVGVDADYTWDASRFTAKAGGTTIVSLPFGNQASVVGKIGVVNANGASVYALGGITWGQSKDGSAMGTTLNFDGPTGTTFGAGMTYPLAKNLDLFGEYRHIDFGNSNGDVMAVSTTENVVRGGIRIKF